MIFNKEILITVFIIKSFDLYFIQLRLKYTERKFARTFFIYSDLYVCTTCKLL